MLRKSVVGIGLFIGFMGALPHLLHGYDTAKLRSRRGLEVLKDKFGSSIRTHLQDPATMRRIGFTC